MLLGHRFSFAAAIAATLLDAAGALAASFDVDARIFCPASLEVDGSGAVIGVDAGYEDGSVRWVPCAGILVLVMDSDDDFDDVCDLAFTDSQGFVRFRGASCSDPTNDPDVYLKIVGESALNFSVGTYDFDFLDALADIGFVLNPVGFLATVLGGATLPNFVTSYEPASWETGFPKEVADGGFLDFGERALSDAWHSFKSGSPNLIQGSSSWGASDNKPPRWAARQFWAASQATWRIARGTVYQPGRFSYMVDHPLFGSPTTLYDLVVVKDGEFEKDASDMLEATPHEIGHVLHNRYHSNYDHWVRDDALSYAKNHGQCREDTLILAWYEGFANFIEDYVNSAGGTSFRGGNVWEPYGGCADAGYAFEGNVQAFLNRIYFGPLDRQYDVSTDPPPGEFSCPSGFTRSPGVGPSDWLCSRERPAVCPPGAEQELLIDELGAWDLCEPVPGLDPPTVGQPATTTFPCAPGELCPAPISVGGNTILLPTDVLLELTGQGGSTSTTVQVTIEPEGSDEEGSEGEGSGEPTWDWSDEIVQVDPDDLIDGDLSGAVRIYPVDCSVWDDPTGTITVQRRSGRDLCIEIAPALWTPPVDPGDPETLRADGTERSVIAPNGSGGREWFALAELDDMGQLVADSGSGPHTLQEHWDRTIESFCRSTDPHGRRYFCNPDASPVFLGETSGLGTLQIGP